MTMATNPNVPADQAAAATNSAPDAKVVSSQPAQQSAATPATSAPAAATPAATAAPAGDQKAADNLKADRKEEQKVGKELESKNQEAAKQDDYFQKVANDDAVFADPFREQARLERQREEDMTKGDPTRDPAAKQAAMDMNTPAPGAKEEAEAIRDGKK